MTSKWVGESERNIRQLFDRARENRPSIVFIDQIDAIAPRRGELHAHDSQVNQLLAEIGGLSGQRGVFIVGATNRPDAAMSRDGDAATPAVTHADFMEALGRLRRKPAGSTTAVFG